MQGICPGRAPAPESRRCVGCRGPSASRLSRAGTVKPQCAINTIAFIVELTEAGYFTEDDLWCTLNGCLEGLIEEKSEQLSVMISLVTNKQGRSRLWDRVLQTLQSRLETNFGHVFGSESPMSDGTCYSDEGFAIEAPAEIPGSWDSPSEHLVSMVNCVLKDSVAPGDGAQPRSNARSKVIDKSRWPLRALARDGVPWPGASEKMHLPGRALPKGGRRGEGCIGTGGGCPPPGRPVCPATVP